MMTKHSPLRVACSPLSGRIQVGRVSASRPEFVGSPQDVTSDFMAALVAHAEFHGGDFQISQNGQPAFDVVVSKVSAPMKDNAHA